MRYAALSLILALTLTGCSIFDSKGFEMGAAEGISFEYDPRENLRANNKYALIIQQKGKWHFASFIDKPSRAEDILPPYEVLVISENGKHVQPYWVGGMLRKNAFGPVYVWSCSNFLKSICRKYHQLSYRPLGIGNSNNTTYYAVSENDVADAYYESGVKSKIEECADNTKKLEQFVRKVSANHTFTNRSGFELTDIFKIEKKLNEPITCNRILEEYTLTVTGRMKNNGRDATLNPLTAAKTIAYSAEPSTLEFNFAAYKKKLKGLSLNKKVAGKEIDVNLISLENHYGKTELLFETQNNSSNFIEIRKVSVSYAGETKWTDYTEHFPPNSKSKQPKRVRFERFDSLEKTLDKTEADNINARLEVSIMYTSNEAVKSEIFKLASPLSAYLE